MTSQYGPGCRTHGFFNVPARFCDFCEFSSLIVLVILVRMARSGRAYLNPILVLARIRHILSRIALVLQDSLAAMRMAVWIHSIRGF